MFRKSNLKILIIVFVLLLGIVVVTKLFNSNKGERTFRKEFFSIDTAQITSILLYPKATGFNEVKISRNGNNWNVSGEGKNYVADKNAITAMLGEFTRMKPDRVAATTEEKWAQFEVNDTLGSRVKVFAGEQMLTDIMIGKFSYQQPSDPYQRQGKMTSYVRLTDEVEVYSTEGFLSMAFNRGANDLRNKTVINSDQDNWTRLTFNYPADSSFILVKENNTWMINGLMADSNEVKTYISSIARLSSQDIIENTNLVGQPALSLSIDGNNVNPVIVDAYPADTINKYIIESNANPETQFSGGRTDLMNKIFVSGSKFMVKEPLTE